ncbi:AmmeMemoRadiSam system protein B [candidate division WOR-3 bacterium]|nr:AmmeMemoRadiSam system protein B [candidate division WOR-3 bacterium]
MPDKVRKPSASGQFYPSEKNSLNEILSTLFAGSGDSNGKYTAKGLILPHAGYIFSGKTTAKAVEKIDTNKHKKPTLIIFGPCHRFPSKGASVFKSGFWETPLGSVEIDKDISEALIQHSSLFDDEELPHMQEHSIEVQLPFFQYVFKNNFKIVPIAIGNQASDFCLEAGEKLKPFINSELILVASSDLYHGYSVSDCKKNDSEVIETIKKYDLNSLSRIADHGTESSQHAGCGIGPIITVMKALEDSKKEILLCNRTNSSESPYSSGGYVVGYASFFIR